MVVIKNKRWSILAMVVLACALAPSRAEEGETINKAYEIKSLKMRLIRVDPGEFLMGSPADETNRKANEFEHKVRLTKAFYLQTTPVTQAQYAAIMGNNPSEFHGDELPVENVSWEEAIRFCAELSKREGRTFRLPTEAEWEYAARAGKPGPVAGDGKLDDISWYADNSGRDRLESARLWDVDPDTYFKHLEDNGCGPHRVGTKRPNDWGFYDMEGNIEQWVWDNMYEDYFHDAAARVDPRGPDRSPLDSRVMRGASWGSDPRSCRVAHRDWNSPSTRTSSCGFRIEMDAD